MMKLSEKILDMRIKNVPEGMMPKTPLIERMEKKDAPKCWVAEVRSLHVTIKGLQRLNNDYLDIIDKLARPVIDKTEEVAQLKTENKALEAEIYDIIFYEPHGTDSWGKMTHKQLLALNALGRRLAYKRQEHALLTGKKE